MNNELNQLFSQTIAHSVELERVYKALEILCKKIVGVHLFTIMSNEPNDGLSERLYTNMPEAYPVSGTKPYNRTRWSQITLEQQQIFVANTIEEIAVVFDDYEKIQSLGCESVINIPIVVGDKVLGTINCLHEKNYYTAERIEAAKQLAEPGALCLLLAKYQKEGDK